MERLREFTSLRRECDENWKRILELRRQIERMSPKDRHISDTVSRGKKGKKALGVVKVESDYDYTSINQKRAVLYRRMAKWHEQTALIANQIAEIEEIISSVEDVDTRRILAWYCIDGLPTWKDVAKRMGEGWTDEMCRQRYSRFVRRLDDSNDE